MDIGIDNGHSPLVHNPIPGSAAQPTASASAPDTAPAHSLGLSPGHSPSPRPRPQPRTQPQLTASASAPDTAPAHNISLSPGHSPSSQHQPHPRSTPDRACSSAEPVPVGTVSLGVAGGAPSSFHTGLTAGLTGAGSQPSGGGGDGGAGRLSSPSQRPAPAPELGGAVYTAYAGRDSPVSPPNGPVNTRAGPCSGAAPYTYAAVTDSGGWSVTDQALFDSAGRHHSVRKAVPGSHRADRAGRRPAELSGRAGPAALSPRQGARRETDTAHIFRRRLTADG